VSIARSDVLKAVHVMVDHLMDKGSKEDYYRLNHKPAQDFERMSRLVVFWLETGGVEVTP
jgi:hypothetical protein